MKGQTFKLMSRNFYPGVYCHIFNRGVAGQDIFKDDADYIFYLKRLRSIKERCGVSVVCYCLMPDCLHLLVRQNAKISISRFVQSLHTGYSMYFNKKYDRAGHIFQGSFRQKNIENDYLAQISSHIHLVSGREDYKWSSYPDYIDERQGTLCDKEIVLESVEDYRQTVKLTKVRPSDLWLSYQKNQKVRPLNYE